MIGWTPGSQDPRPTAPSLLLAMIGTSERLRPAITGRRPSSRERAPTGPAPCIAVLAEQGVDLADGLSQALDYARAH
jgi:hypothetical protein